MSGRRACNPGALKGDNMRLSNITALVATGDSSKPLLIAICLIASIILMVVLFVTGRHGGQNNDDEDDDDE